MNVILLLLAITILFSIPLLIEADAQTSYDVNIPTGAANPDATYFWQSEKDGSTSGIIEIMVGDTIVWKNADTAAHTVTSGTASDGPDNLFDSGLFAPGKSFSYKFTETGNYPYFCLVHEWMDGSITVTTGYSIIPNVGKQAGDGSIFFDVEYDFNGVLSTVAIDEQQKSITFEIVSDMVSGNNDLELRLPSELLDGPFVVWVDDQKLSDFEHIQDDGLNVLLVPLDADSKIITIVGTSIVPEFGPMAMVILAVSIVTMVFLSQRFKTRI